MRTRKRIGLAGLVVAFALFQLPPVALAADCAFEDVNDNGIFDVGDTLVTDAQWIGGAAFVSNHPFVVPVGCDKTLVGGLPVTQGVRVTATKITFLGRLDYVPPGGRGVVFIADPLAVPQPGTGNGDLIVGNGVNLAVMRAGGVNTLPASTVAVAQKSVALVGTGACRFNAAEIEGVAPIQNTKVGILCNGGIVFRGTTVVGSKVNIQSRSGPIDAGGGGGGAFSLAALCDSSATNLTGNGNNNGVVDGPDFPCQLNLGGVVNFADATELVAACQITPVGNNKFRAFNDPLIMIAGTGAGNNLDVQGASIVGRYRVTLAAEDGNLFTQNAIIDNGEQLGLTPPGGARIWLFADPTSVVRLPVDREDFLGPSAGSANITGACYQSPNPVQVGQDGGGLVNLIGAPAPAPCLQNPPDFVPVLNGIF
jgi:hypothetical protein